MATEINVMEKIESEVTKKRFPEDANDHYYYSSVEELLRNQNELLEMIQHHKRRQQPRLKELQEYYKGYNRTILKEVRRKEDHLADHRATHNFAKYVSQFIQGYMVGVPIKTIYPKKEMDDKIVNINRDNDADEHNSDLVLDQSIYGRAYELLYRNMDDETRFTILNPLTTFVIYDETVEMKPIAGVRYIYNKFTGKETIHVYTEAYYYIYELSESGLELKEPTEEGKTNPAINPFNGVPIVEYENNSFRQGDFEDVLSLIDLYDSSQSDTGNYMQDFNDALLKITGDVEIDVKQAHNMKQYNILMLKPRGSIDSPNNQVDADYIYKQYDVQGTEAYKDRVFNNILLFTSIPNLLDDKEGTSTQSGEAIKMKLFALSQKRATKERLFKKGLRNRYRLISNVMQTASEGELIVNDFTFVFTENLPKAIDQELAWFTDAGGQLSQKTLLTQLSFVENVDEELELIEEENEQNKVQIDYNNEFSQNRDMNSDTNIDSNINMDINNPEAAEGNES